MNDSQEPKAGTSSDIADQKWLEFPRDNARTKVQNEREELQNERDRLNNKIQKLEKENEKLEKENERLKENLSNGVCRGKEVCTV
ncbi:hypothetical protein CERZMDRAFT_97318 [Cercospora zeae-maydis SCOH1-5]|uniref:BZIP domain-containing protein n=1 Tax=Cercospora zeae-maydis SCOH1-5 TaxID=717836 RepID=A0A6A6FH72_9PEZI|nr:hypothetical protein CERZMDRAFT_97318 [Cercospora zeae-maydis SCOH1-5]